MARDLDTFLTAVYAIVDDLYRERLAAALGHRPVPMPVKVAGPLPPALG